MKLWKRKKTPNPGAANGTVANGSDEDSRTIHCNRPDHGLFRCAFHSQASGGSGFSGKGETEMGLWICVAMRGTKPQHGSIHGGASSRWPYLSNTREQLTGTLQLWPVCLWRRLRPTALLVCGCLSFSFSFWASCEKHGKICGAPGVIGSSITDRLKSMTGTDSLWSSGGRICVLEIL